jgi:hypothetical protein
MNCTRRMATQPGKYCEDILVQNPQKGRSALQRSFILSAKHGA